MSISEVTYAQVQIETSINYEPLRWVPIMSISGKNAGYDAVRFGDTLRQGFNTQRKFPTPNLRIVDKDGKDIGGWGADG